MSYRKNRIYLDYASATPVRKEARRAYEEASSLVGNPGSIHREGVEAKRVLEESRAAIAKELGCKAREIVFTSGLTEANNLAILGHAQHLLSTRKASPCGLEGTHWIVSSIEHQSVLECFVEIERRGGLVTHVDPEEGGIISAEKVTRALRSETVLVSVGWANSEIGTVQPLRDIAAALRTHEKKAGTKVLLHSDTGQGPLYRSPEVHTLGVDLFSLGSGKLYGPRGIGALYVGRRAEVAPLAIGGGQERGLRAGTETPALAAGFAAALLAAGGERCLEATRLTKLRDELARILTERIPSVVVNGSTSLTTSGDLRHALPHMLNISISGINSEYVCLALDRAGVAISTKSACSEGRLNESHVVLALHGDKKLAASTLRCSLGQETRRSHLLFFVKSLTHILQEMPVSEL